MAVMIECKVNEDGELDVDESEAKEPVRRSLSVCSLDADYDGNHKYVGVCIKVNDVSTFICVNASDLITAVQRASGRF